MSDWFESEIERISHKWYRLCMNIIPTTHPNYSPRYWSVHCIYPWCTRLCSGYHL